MSGLDKIAAAYETLKGEIEPLLFVARDKGLQQQAGAIVSAFIDQAEGERLSAILAGDGTVANDLLALISVAKSLAAEVNMYVLLKDGESEKAWNLLIDAQDLITAAGSASKSLTNLDAKFDHLRELERWLFPPQSFVSVGLIVTERHCSICQDSYEKCDHIAGRAYMGRFCTLVIKAARPDHIALVESPYDRRCRVTDFAVPSGRRNKMTWVVTPATVDERGNINAILAIEDSSIDRVAGQRDIDDPGRC